MRGSELLELLERIGTLLRAERRAAGGAYNLQPVHLEALSYLARCNRFSDTPAAVSAYLGVTKGTASQSLLVLERRGYVKKTLDKHDRRVVHVMLTRKGRNLLTPLQEGPWGNAASILDAAEAETARSVLETLLRRLQQINQGQTFGACRTCRHLLREGEKRFRCGLTQERLVPAETNQICREHALAEGA